MRKLAIGAFAFSISIFAANYIFDRSLTLYAALLCAAAGAALLAVRLKALRGAVIAAFAAAFGLLVFSAHYDLTVERAHRLAGETGELRFVLLGEPERFDSYSRADARLSVKGLPKLKCILYDSEGRLDALESGELITAKVKLSAADLRYGVRTERYTSRDVYLTATVKGTVLVLGRKPTIESLGAAIAEKIAGRADAVFPKDTAPFAKALILGDKNDLYRDDALYVALNRAGLMHIAAVSGMHVSYLVSILRFLFGKGKRSALVCLLLVWSFVLISGLSPSATRAAFMQTMLLIAPLVGRENDPITSLSAALAVLLFLNPFAAANISLQLSFAAMLGLMSVGGALEEYFTEKLSESRAAGIVKYPVGIVCFSLGVMVFTIPIMAANFGYVTLLSPLSNLLCLWAVPICFVGSFLACALSFIPPLGSLTALGISLLMRWIFRVAEWVSSLDFSVVYLSHRLNLVWIVLFYLSIAAVFVLKLKPRWKIAIPLATAVISLLLSHAALVRFYSSADGTVAAIDVGQGQCLAAFAGESTVLIDCGSTSYAEYNAGDEAAGYLKSCGREKIDTLIFTHLHADHANGLERLANLMEIDRILLPVCSGDEEALRETLSCALRHGIRVESVSDNRAYGSGEIGLLLLGSMAEGSGNERCMPVVVSIAGYQVITTGDAPAAREAELVRMIALQEIDALIVGHHGSKSASCEEYLSALGGRRAIISVGKNGYGLPSPEILERLRSFGYTVSRTDQDGTVELRING